MKSRWLPLGLFLLITFLAAGIGALATSTSVDTWYPTLNKPSWNPPSSVFSPVWTTLYLCMAIAVWRVWRDASPIDGRHTVRLYIAQLALNALWSILFFGLRNPGAALIEIIVLWLVLIRILIRFHARDRIASFIWAPYVLWVTFATVLNAAIWELN